MVSSSAGTGPVIGGVMAHIEQKQSGVEKDLDRAWAAMLAVHAATERGEWGVAYPGAEPLVPQLPPDPTQQDLERAALEGFWGSLRF